MHTQVEFDDGAQLWMEQTCHHPPVAAFFLEGADKEYSASGVMQFSVGFGYNKMLITPQVCREAATLRAHACTHAQSHTKPDFLFEDSGTDDVRAPSNMRHGSVYY